jgi:uncharacterized protein (TIGR02284 family)
MNAARAINELNKLIDACRIGVESSKAAGKEAQDIGLRSLMTGYVAQRADFAAILQAEVTLLDSGSAAVATTADPKDPLIETGTTARRDDATILADCELGVAATMDAYRGALRHADLPFRLRAIINRQYQRIELSRAGMAHLRQRHV